MAEARGVEHDEESKLENKFREKGLDDWIDKIKTAFEIPNLKLLKEVEDDEFEDFLSESKCGRILKRSLFKIFKSIGGDETNDSVVTTLSKDEGQDDTIIGEKATKLTAFPERTELSHETPLAKALGQVVRRKESEIAEQKGEIQSLALLSQKLQSHNYEAKGNSNSTTMSKQDIASNINTKTLSAKTLATFVDGGLLCRGVFLCNYLSELEKVREPAIEISDDLEFRGTQSVQERFQREFHSETIREIFEKNIDKSRSSKSGSAHAGLVVWGINISAFTDYSRRKKSELVGEVKRSTDENYIASLHYEMVPIKAIYLTKNDIDLKPEVLDHLKTIEKDLRQVKYKPKKHFRPFYGRFGSHVNYGLIEFGGILLSNSYCKGFKENRRSELSKLMSSKSEVALGTGVPYYGVEGRLDSSYSASQLHSGTSQKFTGDVTEEMKSFLTKIGGPKEIDDKDQWKKALVEDSSLWRIINRSSRPKPIWELLEKYKGQFHNYFLLANAMEEEWKTLTSLKSTGTDRKLDSLKKEVSLWIELNREEENPVNSMKNLSRLRYKHEIMDEDWLDEVLYLQEVQEIITKAARSTKRMEDPYAIGTAIEYIQNVLHPSNKIEKAKFKYSREIIKIITEPNDKAVLKKFDMKTITELPDILQSLLQSLDPGKDGHEAKLRRSQQRLERTLKAWSKKTEKSYEFLTSIGVLRLFGLSLPEFQFEYHLVRKDMEDIIKTITKHLNGISSLADVLKKQAYVMRLALASTTQREFGVEYMIQNIPEAFCKRLKDTYDKAKQFDGSLNTETLQRDVAHLLDETIEDIDLKSLIRSFKTQFYFPKGKKVAHQESNNAYSMERNVDSKVETLLEELNITKYYPQKLRYEDVIKLTSDVLDDKPKNPASLSDLPWYFMRHIIGLDSDTRENCHTPQDIKQNDSQGYQTLADSNEETATYTDEDFSDDSDDFDDDIGEVDEKDEDMDVHPLDLIYIILICADDFLRQELLDKMAKCQYAVPAILPPVLQNQGDAKSVVLHWGLRSMSRNFYKNRQFLCKTLVDLESPLVTYMSLGDETSWKSKLLNKMLSPLQQTFWHQGLKGGNLTQRVSQGLVEMAWYLPGQQDDDMFLEPITYSNIRGDSLDYEIVSDKLMEHSSVICLFLEDIKKMTKEFLMNRQKMLGKMVLVVLYKDHGKGIQKKREKLQNMFKLDKYQIICKAADDANFNEVYEELKSSVKSILKRKKKMFSLSSFTDEMSINRSLDIDDKYVPMDKRQQKES